MSRINNKYSFKKRKKIIILFVCLYFFENQKPQIQIVRMKSLKFQFQIF